MMRQTIRTIILTIVFSLVFLTCGVESVGASPFVDVVPTLENRVICSQYRVSFYNTDDVLTSEAVSFAADKWNISLGEDRFVFVGTEVCDVRDINMRVVDNGSMDPAAVTTWSDEPCFCSIKAQESAAVVWQLWAHELGHCLGLDHSPGGLMDGQTIPFGAEITVEMADRVQEITQEVVGHEESFVPSCQEGL